LGREESGETLTLKGGEGRAEGSAAAVLIVLLGRFENL